MIARLGKKHRTRSPDVALVGFKYGEDSCLKRGDIIEVDGVKRCLKARLGDYTSRKGAYCEKWSLAPNETPPMPPRIEHFEADLPPAAHETGQRHQGGMAAHYMRMADIRKRTLGIEDDSRTPDA